MDLDTTVLLDLCLDHALDCFTVLGRGVFVFGDWLALLFLNRLHVLEGLDEVQVGEVLGGIHSDVL